MSILFFCHVIILFSYNMMTHNIISNIFSNWIVLIWIFINVLEKSGFRSRKFFWWLRLQLWLRKPGRNWGYPDSMNTNAFVIQKSADRFSLKSLNFFKNFEMFLIYHRLSTMQRGCCQNFQALLYARL